MANTQFHQPHGFAPLPPVPNNKVVASRGWYIGKIVLGGLSILASLVVVGLGGGIIAAQSPYPAASGYIDAAMALPPAVLSIAWQIAEYITLCVRRNRGIHPGAHVGVHLVVWLACVVVGGMMAAFFAYDVLFSGWYVDDGLTTSTITKGYALYLNIEETLMVFLWPLAIIHFILFVRFCIECHRRNMNRMLARHVNNPVQQVPPPSAMLSQTDKYPAPPLSKADVLQQRSHSSTPVQFQYQAQQPASELGSGMNSPPTETIEMGGGPRYAEMAGVPRYVEIGGGQRYVEADGRPRYFEMGGDTTYAPRGPGYS